MNKKTFSSIHNPPYSRLRISRKGLERLDLLLLAIETLEINATDRMLSVAKQIGIDSFFPNNVELWKKRCHNPYRKNFRRGNLSNDEVEAFILLISSMSDRLYPYIRQLLSSRESQTINKQRWQIYISRMSDLIKTRMNSKKIHIINMLKPEDSYLIFRHILFSLSLASGPGGVDRLRASLFDNE